MTRKVNGNPNKLVAPTADGNREMTSIDAFERIHEYKNMGLTKRKEAFVKEYLKDMDSKAAAIRAGYKKTTAERASNSILNDPRVRDAINKELEKRAENEKLSVQLVIKAFLRIAKEAESEGSYSNALRAWENIARYLGMFVERSESVISMEDRVGSDAKQTTAELKRLLKSAVTKKSA